MELLEKLYIKIETGRLVNYLSFLVLLIISVGMIISGIDFSEPVIYENTQNEIKRYIIQKVSRLPKIIQEADAEEKIEKEDVLTINDLRKRYIAYVISRIEQNKIYPIKEQRLNHEGVVKFVIELDRKGDVLKFLFVQKSAYEALNNSTLLSVSKSQPFVPFPVQLPEDKMRIHINMNYCLE